MDNIIHPVRNEPPLLAPIFRSGTQARLLSELLLTGDELSLSDLAQRTESPYATAHREVGRLIDAGILVERAVARTRLVRANADSPLVSPLRDILATVTGPVVYLRQQLAAIAGVDSAFIYGSFAARASGIEGPPPNDVDVMVIGTADLDEVHEACDRVEANVKRPVNATLLTSSEFERESTTGFLTTVMTGPRLPIIGDPS